MTTEAAVFDNAYREGYAQAEGRVSDDLWPSPLQVDTCYRRKG
ncbi:hypothetical protein Afer_0303 [Acidimicrobium ferrooxidans DSM 10331]|uniref:Uncharacterized protein n=1 Tax=Acidimicrobium ferrooxidans (strain DSM 10331 / JCM 15462 / NBRC 103882 / ICP) TaxID=525909 RepID=C7M2M8_ACIFD|nr:hypothetical protein Afer_0303 [Acidimicrobium ferrooxidans DSM 10331]